MADSDCSECKYNHNYGGRCPYDEYDCVFYPLDVLAPEYAESAIYKAQELKAAFDEFESTLMGCITGGIDAARYEIDNIYELFSHDKLKEYRSIIKEEEESDG